MAGYSKAPLERKLGLKDGQRAAWIGLPDTLATLPRARAFAATERAARARDLPPGPYDIIHIFTDSRAELAADLATALDRLDPNGVIWASWPKKASKIPTDITEDVIRAIALAAPLVDVKVCAIDDVWSGLKLMIRKELRAR